MDRREFIRQAGLATGGLITTVSHAASPATTLTRNEGPIRWTRASQSRLFSSVACDGVPLVTAQSPGLLDGTCRLWQEAPAQATRLGPAKPSAKHGPLQVELNHSLQDSGTGQGEDLLQATLTVHNESDRPQQVEVTFITSADPPHKSTGQQTYLPLNAAGLHNDKRFTSVGVKGFLKDCNQVLGPDPFNCHYLEPMASYPDERETKALLLVPVLDVQQPYQPWRVALFTSPDGPMKFTASITSEGKRIWRVGRVVTVPAGSTFRQSCWLLIHRGDAAVAWKAFHRFAHHERHPRIDWIRDFKVHYYDFLSSAEGKNGHRGNGYDAALPHFRQFHVGLGTQHGYYPCMGDHIHPERKTWLAMQSDKQGPEEMSLERIKARIQATRATGAKAAIYMHLTALDDSSQVFYPGLAAGRRVGPDGQPMIFGWNGPDVKGSLWWMSIASPEWRAHLLQQAQWIMEILQPDAICMDETFSGVGYDEAPDRRGPISPHAIGFFAELHALIRSFGDDKAFFTSDCSMSGFSLWADGEVGDHAYPGSLGNPLYRQEPVRYLAVLGDKPWRPCAWHFQHMWEHQMALARQVGSGVGVSNGWIEYTGLHGLPLDKRKRLVQDIESLL